MYGPSGHLLARDEGRDPKYVMGVDLASGPDQSISSIVSVGMVDGKVVYFREYIHEDEDRSPIDSEDK